jgi:hypothetical protein
MMNRDVVKYRIDSIDKLKTLGLREIYDRTFISVGTLKKILNYNFNEINPIHFKGFLRILRREFPHIDWKDFQAQFERYKLEMSGDMKPQDKLLTEVHNETRKQKILTISLLSIIAILISTLFYITFDSSEDETMDSGDEVEIVEFSEEPEDEALDIEEITQYSSDENITKTLHKDDVLFEKPKILRISAFKDVWLGRVYPDSDRKKVSSTVERGDTIDLNGSLKQLLYFGHGEIEIEYRYGTIRPDDSSRHYYIYREDGDISEINRGQFIELNGGKVW